MTLPCYRCVASLACILFLSTAMVQSVRSAQVDLRTGQTSVVLDTATLAAAASLNLSGVSPGVISPGALAGSVAFPINARDAMTPALPTTFSYDSDNFLGSFSGSIEHTGSVFFNANAVEVGNFKIGFNASRAGTLNGAASGFFVESTTGIPAILFDIENPSTLTPTTQSLTVAADLLVSPEFAGFLQANNLATANLAGADVGDALVQAFVPEPSSSALLALGVAVSALRLRRSKGELKI